MHDLYLPVAPKIDAAIAKSIDGAGYTVTLQSAALARSVYISFGDIDTQFSDNYMDILPGEPLTITVTSSASLDQLKSAMKLTSLTESYESRGAS
jgi:beta-mannosidase